MASSPTTNGPGPARLLMAARTRAASYAGEKGLTM